MANLLRRGAIPGVSRWYRYDWQFAADLNKIPFVQEAAFLISITPVIAFVAGAISSKFEPSGHSSPLLWMIWSAAMAFVLARILYYFACPKFIWEYRDFGAYSSRQHSHRWIVWEFYHNLRSLPGWKRIVDEVSPKGLTVEVGQLPREIAQRLDAVFGNPGTSDLRVLAPVNIERDIYLPIIARGKKLVLPMQEADPDLPKKEKELFWILYSQAAKERPILRTVYWLLVGIALFLVLASMLIRMYLVVNGPRV